MISRRAALAGIAGLLPGAMIQSAQAQTSAAVTGAHSFKVGDFDVTVVSDGTMDLPVAFALPGRTPADIAAMYSANGAGTAGLPVSLTGQINITVVKTPTAVVVIDAGGGTEFMPTMGQFGDNLERAGIRADSVTHVLFTHAHADHFWGLIDPLDDATRFAKARHIITATEFDYWTKPGMETGLPEALRGVAMGSARRLKALAGRLERVGPNAEILPGVTLFATPGHTPGHTAVLLSSGGQQLLVGGDVLTNPVVSFAEPDWVWGPDADHTQAVQTRRRTLDLLATDKIQLLGYHLPWPGIGRVERRDTAFRFVAG
jgi:glyoxylase-like metal-dependent hydrolase (beta-lactamase superfamily II)